MIDELLKKYNLRFEDLTSEEKTTLLQWHEDWQKGQLTIDKIKFYISAMKDAVEDELSKEPVFIHFLIFKRENPKLMLLQARLRNYLLLEALLSSEEKAKERIEEALGRISDKGAEI